jgi:hypothetical protein
MTDAWSWLALAGLGAFHGLNPAMGWLFAVALGLHRQSRTIIYVSLLPIAFGHALSVALVAAALVWAGLLIDAGSVRMGSGVLLIAWAAYHWRQRYRHRVRIGMQTGLFGLGVWSFLMATAHGAGLMLWPALMPLCFPPGSTSAHSSPLFTAAMGVGVHTLMMLAVIAVVAGAVYEWIGLGVLRQAWINVDLVWTIALIAAGILLLSGI